MRIESPSGFDATGGVAPRPVIARTFKVHAGTVRRWVEEVRGQIVDETYRLLKGKLQLSSNEMKSLMKVLHSQLEQSISRLLK